MWLHARTADCTLLDRVTPRTGSWHPVELLVLHELLIQRAGVEKIRVAALDSNARAMASRCRSPPLSRTPFSPISVSRKTSGLTEVGRRLLSRNASTHSSSVALCEPGSRFSRT